MYDAARHGDVVGGWWVVVGDTFCIHFSASSSFVVSTALAFHNPLLFSFPFPTRPQPPHTQTHTLTFGRLIRYIIHPCWLSLESRFQGGGLSLFCFIQVRAFEGEKGHPIRW